MTALWTILELSAAGRQDETARASYVAGHESYVADLALERAAKRYRAHSVRMLELTRAGSAGVILTLFAAFAVVYWRVVRARRTAEALAAENRRLPEASREDALTATLTGLRNRRALRADVAAWAGAGQDGPLALALFDLDGFKQYNDTFGHAAGDALLARLGERLAETGAGVGTAYRMGGDEFCVLAADPAAAIASLAAAALAEGGEGFTIECSYGVALMPSDTTDPDMALMLADQRMYEQKRSGRVPTSRQSAAVLLQLLAERSSALGRHTGEVASLAEATAARLGLRPAECERIRLAAELHDVGKAAIPDAILEKPGPLDAAEWEFVRSHSVVGERILRAAPSLAHAADLVRWHHERYDGAGYPDRLAGESIPLGAPASSR